MMEPLALARETVTAEISEAKDAIDLIRELSVADDGEQEFAAEILRDIKERYNIIEARRKAITVPLNTALKEVNDLFRPVREAYEQSERILKSKIANYLLEKEARNRAALQAAAEAKTPQEASAALSTVSVVEPAKGVSVRQVWKFEIIVPDLVPYEFLSPDPDKIAKASPGPIPGVRFFQEPIVTSRRAK